MILRHQYGWAQLLCNARGERRQQIYIKEGYRAVTAPGWMAGVVKDSGKSYSKPTICQWDTQSENLN